MKKTDDIEMDIMGNDTGMRMREPKNIRPKNSDLIKALALVDYEYEEYEEYDAPIIEIRFKRGTTTAEDVDDAFNKMRKTILKENGLVDSYMKWSRRS